MCVKKKLGGNGRDGSAEMMRDNFMLLLIAMLD